MTTTACPVKDTPFLIPLTVNMTSYACLHCEEQPIGAGISLTLDDM
jgi:hypothetical protein